MNALLTLPDVGSLTLPALAFLGFVVLLLVVVWMGRGGVRR